MSTLDIAIHADGVNNIVTKMGNRSNRVLPAKDWIHIGSFLRLKFDGGRGHIQTGRSPFTVIDPLFGGSRGHLEEIDWKWDDLFIRIGLNIPKVTVGGWKIPLTNIRLPKVEFFGSDPDVQIQVNLRGLRHEISTAFDIDVRGNSTSEAFELYLRPQMPLDVDLLDIADMVGDFLENAVQKLVNDLLAQVPGWLRSVVNSILRGIVRLVREILDFTDDVIEWISRKIGVSLGLFNIVSSLVIYLLFRPDPFITFENPYQILPSEGSDPAVKLALNAVSATFDEQEQSIQLSLNF